jgi:hypothetical protein
MRQLPRIRFPAASVSRKTELCVVRKRHAASLNPLNPARPSLARATVGAIDMCERRYKLRP